MTDKLDLSQIDVSSLSREEKLQLHDVLTRLDSMLDEEPDVEANSGSFVSDVALPLEALISIIQGSHNATTVGNGSGQPHGFSSHETLAYGDMETFVQIPQLQSRQDASLWHAVGDAETCPVHAALTSKMEFSPDGTPECSPTNTRSVASGQSRHDSYWRESPAVSPDASPNHTTLVNTEIQQRMRQSQDAVDYIFACRDLGVIMQPRMSFDGASAGESDQAETVPPERMQLASEPLRPRPHVTEFMPSERLQLSSASLAPVVQPMASAYPTSYVGSACLAPRSRESPTRARSRSHVQLLQSQPCSLSVPPQQAAPTNASSILTTTPPLKTQVLSSVQTQSKDSATLLKSHATSVTPMSQVISMSALSSGSVDGSRRDISDPRRHPTPPRADAASISAIATSTMVTPASPARIQPLMNPTLPTRSPRLPTGSLVSPLTMPANTFRFQREPRDGETFKL